MVIGDPAAVSICPLTKEHILCLINLYNSSSPDYSKYFTPFEFTEEIWHKILQNRRNDLYYVICYNNEVTGFSMLRGFDQGYQVPSFGVWIAQQWTGRGLATTALEHAITVCREYGCRKLMLKVHPEHHKARLLYESFGFHFVGIDSKNKNLVLELHF